MPALDGDWPRLLESHYSAFDSDLPFWISLAESYGGPVLELGCGPGRVTFELARRGFEVIGIDNDPAMLARARAHTPDDVSARVRLIEADLRDFALPDRFGLALIPCNTLAALDEADVLACLTQVHVHLRAGGALAFEIPNPDESINDGADDSEPITEFFESETGRPVQVYARQKFDPARRRMDIDWCYDELLPDGRTQRMIVPAIYYLRSVDEMTHLLARAGFRPARFLGDYAGGPLMPTSERLLAVALA